MSLRQFAQIDVFTTEPYRGNPVAVVLDGEGLTTEQMQRVAHWTNLSETTFLLPPTQPGADYRVRIFTPGEELPFAGHPTLGSCHAWRIHHRHDSATVVQECGAGLVTIRATENGLAFAAPPLVREGPVEESLRQRLIAGLGLDAKLVQDAQWVDNGPGWIALLVDSAETVLEAFPGDLDMKVGIVGPHPAGSPYAFEVRAFFQPGRSTVEDPVTGSFNASLAQWLVGTGRAEPPYVVRQGTALGRDGRVHIDRDPDGTIWVGGGTVTCIRGEIEL